MKNIVVCRTSIVLSFLTVFINLFFYMQYNFAKVPYPKNAGEKQKKEYEQRKATAVVSGLTEEQFMARFPFVPFDAVNETRESLIIAINNYVQLKNQKGEEKRNQNPISVPFEERAMIARITRKLEDMEGDTVEFSDKEAAYIKKALTEKNTLANSFVYIYEAMFEEYAE